MLDIINNNVTFVLPNTYGNDAEIYIEEFSGDRFKEMYQRGSFSKVDYVKSEFSAYRVMYRWKDKKGR